MKKISPLKKAHKTGKKYPNPPFQANSKNSHLKVARDCSEEFMTNILKGLYTNPRLEHEKVLLFFLKRDTSTHLDNSGFSFKSKESEKSRHIDCNEATIRYLKSFSDSYKDLDIHRIREEIYSRWNHRSQDAQKSPLGKYYTPQHLSNLVVSYANPFLLSHPKAMILDSCAGFGALLSTFPKDRVIATDIDVVAFEILKELGYKHVKNDNSLLRSHRKKYGLYKKTPLLIIGNPPYNDITSQYKREGSHLKQHISLNMDDTLISSDYGHAFLKHYASLSPDEIVVLHPLSYLIKRENFRRLQRDFFSHYALKQATVFSSKEFGQALKSHKTPFPIICAHYTRGSMNYEDVRAYRFPILADQDTPNSHRILCLENLYTIDDYGIRKYPPSKDMPKISEVGLYQYHIRDANSLSTSGNITTSGGHYRIPVMEKNLHEYAYLNAYRRYVNYPYYLGNISPLCPPDLLDDPQFRDFLILDLALQFPSLSAFDVSNPRSFIRRSGLWTRCRSGNTHLFYKMFAKAKNNKISANQAKSFFKAFFSSSAPIQNHICPS